MSLARMQCNHKIPLFFFVRKNISFPSSELLSWNFKTHLLFFFLRGEMFEVMQGFWWDKILNIQGRC